MPHTTSILAREPKCSRSRTYNKVPRVELEGDAEPSQDIEPRKAIGPEAGGKVCHGDLTQWSDHSRKRQAPRVDDRNASRNPSIPTKWRHLVGRSKSKPKPNQ